MIQVPPPELLRSGWLPILRVFVSRLLPLIQLSLPLVPTSWFRTANKNRDVGGDPESQHLFGLALDVDGSEEALRRAFVAARRVGLFPVMGAGFLHVQLFPEGALARAGVTFPKAT